ncbi:MAG: FIG003003: hypothetical protein [uncultured Chloroflexi bacterium]|uniref:DUF72 domain-containing protein n=1 Tax=uncultured Chloroflexota bacterium TaxID=166587 RepID=A0A6J4IYZ1_9CHLR|nr:MAG: FIG003003: hypothetical protein [uncultured Chloroflexota bacterium]
MTEVTEPARAVARDAPILIGTCSWTDPTILKSGWYPPEASSAEQRLAHYASKFPVVEVDSTYYSLPSERNAVLWAERTPDAFTFDFKAFGLMTGHGAAVAKLPPIIRDSLPADFGAGKRQIYLKDLPESAQAWIWDAFARALDPLACSGKLGFILLQFPPWFGINRANKEYIERARSLLPEHKLAVEFRNGSWLEERNIPETGALLAANDLTYVAVDEPQGFRSSVPLVPLVTNSDLAVLRLHGRNAENWQAKDVTVAERFKYLYSDAELAGLAPVVQQLAEQAEQTHVLFNNCYSDYGVRNAEQLAARLNGASPTP